jgi:amidase
LASGRITQASGSKGGNPNAHPACESGQDGFLASMATNGVKDDVYWQSLAFCQRNTREEGIDAAPSHEGDKLDALSIPTDVAQSV